VLTSRKHKQSWSVVLEQIEFLHLELCVDLRLGRKAKDGLHQYRGACQNNGAMDSFQRAIRHFLKLAEGRAEQAREEADAFGAQVDDLEEGDTEISHEAAVLNSVTGEDAKDRSDREIVMPHMKMLWETYRTVLEMLRHNAKLGELYREAAHGACGSFFYLFFFLSFFLSFFFFVFHIRNIYMGKKKKIKANQIKSPHKQTNKQTNKQRPLSSAGASSGRPSSGACARSCATT
jgi:hypothetical protein